MYIQPKHHVGEKVFFMARAKSSNGPELPALSLGTIKAVAVDAYQELDSVDRVDISYRVHVGAAHVFITDEDIVTEGFSYPALTLSVLEDAVKEADEEAAKNTKEALELTRKMLDPNLSIQEDERG